MAVTPNLFSKVPLYNQLWVNHHQRKKLAKLVPVTSFSWEQQSSEISVVAKMLGLLGGTSPLTRCFVLRSCGWLETLCSLMQSIWTGLTSLQLHTEVRKCHHCLGPDQPASSILKKKGHLEAQQPWPKEKTAISHCAAVLVENIPAWGGSLVRFS